MPSRGTGRRVTGCLGTLAVLPAMLCGSVCIAQTPAELRAVTVRDVIEMSMFGSLPHDRVEVMEAPDPLPSPDKRSVAVVVQRGRLADNTVVYSLLVFRTGVLFRSPVPDTVAVFRSSSNRPGIAHLVWLTDGHTLAFLGERQGELPQVYTVDIRTRRLTQRTHHSTVITSFAIARGGDPIVYMADLPAPDTSDRAAKREHGFVAQPDQYLSDLVAGHWERSLVYDQDHEMFALHRDSSHPTRVNTAAPVYTQCRPWSLSIAPDGDAALVICERAVAPAAWGEYIWHRIREPLALGYPLNQFLLLDLRQGTSRPLLDAPIGWVPPSVAWAPDSKSVVVANSLLPLAGADSNERTARRAMGAVAEVDVRTGHVTTILQRDSLDVAAWDAGTQTIDLVPGEWGYGSPDGAHVYYQKTAAGWREVQRGAPAGTVPEGPHLVIDQGMNTPPRLVAVDPATQRRMVVFDPNPQFAHIRWAREQVERWTTKAGAVWYGGLYVPADYQSGQRYPLVIQTHDFDSTEFWPDGAYATANTAQALAARGIMVLQIPEHAPGAKGIGGTPREAPAATEGIEAAIDHLDRLGLIDPKKVGLIGFSRTCFHVKYMLGHSTYPIAAAAVTDGVDFSYLQVMLGIINRRSRGEVQGIYGGVPPFGTGLERWLADAPDFSMDRWTAPLRIEASGPAVIIMQEWEAYAGLLMQGKPVEMMVLPDAAHVMVKPWHRLASEGGNLDWFRFWLTGEEDPDPAKQDQYRRWRTLRELQHRAPLPTSSGGGGVGGPVGSRAASRVGAATGGGSF